ncbi:hypothetical protein L207DRAFT_627610 [Hyaloscypha variabilis F]|uniref:Mid2 domain-containing protein n=1 Tax=Hyaloscypha variabilis (strain UAMH 11265 / GT02V1 / F) TaxID=1149755 RepID=A0A2J6SDY7_HYAVF|nr:hypothetical protein L207DRAFT_627610 [Hyaloscypha variabilis F]
MLCFNVALLYFFVLFKPATPVEITNTYYGGIQTGSPFNITWDDASGPVTILLREGNTTIPSQAEAKAIWVDLTGTYFTWYPGPILGTGLYRFQLDDAAVEPVYSPLFELTYIPGVYTTSSTTSATPTPTSQPSTAISSNATPTSASTTAANTPTTSAAQTGTSTKAAPKTAVKVGVIIALLFLIALTTFGVISLIRKRAARKKRASQASAAPSTGDGILPKDPDLEHGHGGPAEMSGALDSAISISNGVSSPTTISSSRRPSTRPTTGSDLGMEGLAEEHEMEPVEIGSSEQGPVEIGSSGYGKEMSAQEKGKAVEMEANQRVRFEERKGRRRGVRLLVGRMNIWF